MFPNGINDLGFLFEFTGTWWLSASSWWWQPLSHPLFAHFQEDIRNQLLFNGEQVDRLLAEHRLRTEAVSAQFFVVPVFLFRLECSLHPMCATSAQRKRKCGTRLKVFARRSTGLLLSVALQGAAAYIIILLTITSSSLEDSIRGSSIAFLAPIAGAVVRCLCGSWPSLLQHSHSYPLPPLHTSGACCCFYH